MSSPHLARRRVAVRAAGGVGGALLVEQVDDLRVEARALGRRVEDSVARAADRVALQVVAVARAESSNRALLC